MHNDLNLIESSQSPDQKISDLKNILFGDELDKIFLDLRNTKHDLSLMSSDEIFKNKLDCFLLLAFEKKLKNEPEKIIEIFEPILIKMLSQSARKQKDEMLKLLSSYTAESLTLAHDNKPEDFKTLSSKIVPLALQKTTNIEEEKKITDSLSPHIGKALKRQIHNEKEAIIDVLYPIIGALISKFIKKAFVDLNQKINVQVDHANPLNIIKRKIKSKISGLSESEILFQERLQGKIKSIYLIHKTTGVVISSACHKKPSGEDGDSNLIGGMFTAITGFVNDWIEKGQEQADLSEISYGTSKIFFESSGSLITAVVLDGQLTYYLKANIQKFMETLIQEHHEFIVNFNGDLETVPQNLKNKIHDTISQNSINEKKENTRSKKNIRIGFFLFSFALLFSIYFLLK